jgi:ketosteroid isomerase-like protein
MPLFLMIFSLFSLLFPAAFVAPEAAAAQPASQDPSIIEGADAYLKAVLAGDVPAIAAMFQHDAVVMPPNQPLFKGRAAIGQFYAGLCHGPAKVTAFTFTHLDSTSIGETAYDIGTYKQTLTVPPGHSVEDTGKYSVILKRAGNEWKIAYLIFNSDLPPNLGMQEKH